MNQQQAYQFTIPQNVHFGLGSLKKLPDFLKDNASDHVFLISDHGLESCSQRTPTDGFAEQNGRDAERSGLTYSF